MNKISFPTYAFVKNIIGTPGIVFFIWLLANFKKQYPTFKKTILGTNYYHINTVFNSTIYFFNQ